MMLIPWREGGSPVSVKAVIAVSYQIRKGVEISYLIANKVMIKHQSYNINYKLHIFCWCSSLHHSRTNDAWSVHTP
jgi:hypothetical protein